MWKTNVSLNGHELQKIAITKLKSNDVINSDVAL